MGLTRAVTALPDATVPRSGLLAAAYGPLRPLLFRVDPERSHRLTLATLDRCAAVGLLRHLVAAPVDDPVEFVGLRMRNRLGLGAGLDKDAAHLTALAQLGFGFLEVGTVTPLPQPGNPQPRLFRLEPAQALINRFGFNNVGLDRFLANLDAFRRHAAAAGGTPPVIGVNIGKNAATPIERAIDDYLIGLERAAPLADYVAVNISSPNTRNLRQLQDGDELTQLLGALDAKRAELLQRGARCPPLLLKISPDLDDAQLEWMIAAIRRFAIDAVIATNTTTSRAAVAHLAHGREAGGLSGAPVKAVADRALRQLRAGLPAGYPLIGIGGVMTAADACAKIDAGADLVQVYTGLIYAGPGLIGDAAFALSRSRPAQR